MNNLPSIAPAYCQLCLAENVISTLNGPTCTHNGPSGADWFPTWWNEAPFSEKSEWRRLNWIKSNESKKNKRD